MSGITVLNAVKFVHDGFTVSAFPVGDWNRLEEFTVPGNVPDARYKFHVGASTSRSAILYYRGTKYRVYVPYKDGAIHVDGTTVERV